MKSVTCSLSLWSRDLCRGKAENGEQHELGGTSQRSSVGEGARTVKIMMGRELGGICSLMVSFGESCMD